MERGEAQESEGGEGAWMAMIVVVVVVGGRCAVNRVGLRGWCVKGREDS